jgi:hypothetical protein
MLRYIDLPPDFVTCPNLECFVSSRCSIQTRPATYTTYMRGLPSPLNVPPSLFWDGIDGKWSTFHVSVGTPGQAVRLLPGTSATASDTTLRKFRHPRPRDAC